MKPQRLATCLCATAAAAVEATTTAPQPTTVSVYLPEYGAADWAALRGSIISSDASVTAYTVFCAEKAPTCQIAGELPFVFTEGAHTLVYTGSDPGTLTADLRCALAGHTAATCTGSSSFGAGYREGSVTGPARTGWTRTFSGAAEVTWGVLTLATPGPGGGGGSAVVDGVGGGGGDDDADDGSGGSAAATTGGGGVKSAAAGRRLGGGRGKALVVGAVVGLVFG